MALNVRLLRFNKKAFARFYSYPALAHNKLKPTSKFCTPAVDLEYELEDGNKGRISESIKARKLDFDITQLKDMHELLTNMENVKELVSKKFKKLGDHLNVLKKKSENDKSPKLVEELRGAELQFSYVKEDLTTIWMAVHNAKTKFHSYLLNIPNVVHVDTPSDEDKIVHEFGQPPRVRDPFGHLTIGEKLGIIHYKDPSCYFLKKEAAEFEIAASSFFAENLKSNGFICFCNPDFVKRVLVEGSGVQVPSSDSILTVKDKPQNEFRYTLHLVGSSSFYSFCGFHTKQILQFSCLPLKYFAAGRQYTRTPLDSKLGLYETWQKTANDIFILTRNDPSEMEAQFKQVLDVVISMYEKLGRHFRVVYVKASDLDNWETLRASFRMYSPFNDEYMEIGNISMSDTYVSRRLRMRYGKDEKTAEYVKVISGTVVNVTKLLACILEQDNDQKKFSMPPCLKPHLLH